MFAIHRRPSWAIPESHATPEAVFRDRRRILKAFGLGAASLSGLLSSFAIAPERAPMVGASHHDLEAAGDAGVPACAVTLGYRPAEALRAHQPEFVIEGFGELMGIFGKKAE